MEQHYSQHNMPDFPLIGLIWHRNGQQPAEQWHTDHTNRERPPAATILYGVEIPSAGGGTSVASMRAAYVALPEDERRRLESLTTFNSLDAAHRHAPGGRGQVRQADRASDGAHPSRARLARGVLPHLQGHPHRRHDARGEPTPTWRDLLDRMIRPEIVYHHVWRKGDVLVIDDRATMHRAHGDYDRSQSRVLWRSSWRGPPRL